MRIISILAGKGGVGKTTVAINLACALGFFGKRTGLIDFNFTTSHLTLEFGMIPSATFNDVLKNQATFEEALYPVFNIHVIPASLNLSELENVDVSNLKSRIKEMSNWFDVMILDSAPGFGKEALTALQSSDEAILVVNPTVAAITDAIKCKQLASRLGVHTLGIVLNKYRDKGFEISPKEISMLVGLPLLVVVREDEEFLKSEALRVPMVFYNREKADGFFKLAGLITGEEYEEPEIRRPNIFKRFLAKFF